MAAARRPPSLVAAYMLHQYDWSESSLVVDLFTREQGRVAVVAKGAKRPHSQLRAVLLPFQRLHVAFGRAARAAAPGDEPVPEVQTLRAAEWAGGSVMPGGAALFSGFYLNELLMKFVTRHDPHPALFDLYAATLADLGQAVRRAAVPPASAAAVAGRDEAAVQPVLRAFEVGLLQAVGLLPELSVVTATQQPVDPARRYRIGPDGVGAGRAEADLEGAALIAVQAALQHGSLPALQQACARDLPGWRAALRMLLHYHLGGPQLRTRQLMRDLQTLERS